MTFKFQFSNTNGIKIYQVIVWVLSIQYKLQLEMNENLDPQQRQNSTSGENFYTIMGDFTIVTKKLDFSQFWCEFYHWNC